ncbi:MAG TPA: Gfo/Idh/MocA family oxidoreductase [Phototrophicaceae bacterium]|nr:Gfo/Idh/MocA family oxidoreductase [Phototrophicaceae bacterium]
MDKARLGVIGCGYWGPNLIRNFAELSRSSLVAVADLSDKRLDYIRTRYPEAITTQDYRQFFNLSLDGVIVATPPPTHFAIASECLEHDLHVLVEKPLALSSAEAQTLVQLARSHQRTLMVGHTFTYNPAVRALKQIIDSGELGRILYIDSVRLNLGLYQRGLNVVWDLAPHDVSIIRYLLEREPISVSATGMDCIFKGAYDVAHLHLNFDDQITAHIHVSWLDPCKVRRTTVVGDRKMAVYDDVEPLEKIRIYDKGVEKPPYTDNYVDFQLSYRYGNMVVPYLQLTEPLKIECEHFIECILGVAETWSDGIDGLQVVRTLESAQRSLENGGTQQVIEAQQEIDFEHHHV